jgi:uncharacterized protein YuzE
MRQATAGTPTTKRAPDRMKVTYNSDRDGLRILFSDAPIERTTTEVPDLILDYDTTGAIIGLELQHASERMPDPRVVEFTAYPTTE